ncbi:hemin uptake protein HemP [Aquincola sp. S2]|uniref:Hemin uptake protein HemP n=1 Tax=Pseudaquabacterium terrae TaxID=2732868 RepID=A0ABX2ESY7_9BURK|nr:hemin uptake protein HemP [Aquabacterium terrae]NRF71617.1 hemin uptake protein HemP [Aquabacterium terrae]
MIRSLPLAANAACSSPDGPLVVPVAAKRAGAPCPRLASASILGGGNEIEIDHHGAIYRLRITSLGKLILTK